MTQNNDDLGWIIYVTNRSRDYPAFKTFPTTEEALAYWGRLVAAELHAHCKMEKIDGDWLIRILKSREVE